MMNDNCAALLTYRNYKNSRSTCSSCALKFYHDSLFVNMMTAPNNVIAKTMSVHNKPQ